MRTTIDLDPQSHRLAKAIASQKGISLGKFISEAIRAYCGQSEPMDSEAWTKLRRFTDH
jgi:hypothetical protein